MNNVNYKVWSQPIQQRKRIFNLQVMYTDLENQQVGIWFVSVEIYLIEISY